MPHVHPSTTNFPTTEFMLPRYRSEHDSERSAVSYFFIYFHTSRFLSTPLPPDNNSPERQFVIFQKPFVHILCIFKPVIFRQTFMPYRTQAFDRSVRLDNQNCVCLVFDRYDIRNYPRPQFAAFLGPQTRKTRGQLSDVWIVYSSPPDCLAFLPRHYRISKSRLKVERWHHLSSENVLVGCKCPSRKSCLQTATIR